MAKLAPNSQPFLNAASAIFRYLTSASATALSIFNWLDACIWASCVFIMAIVSFCEAMMARASSSFFLRSLVLAGGEPVRGNNCGVRASSKLAAR